MTVHFFNERSNRVVFRFAGNFCQFFRCMFPILPLLFDIRSTVSQLPDAFGTLEKLGVRLKSRRDAERFFALYSAFHNTTRMPCNRFTASMPRPGGRLSAGTGKFFKEPRSLLPAAAWFHIFLTKR